MTHKIKELHGLAKKLELPLHEVIKLYNERSYKMHLRDHKGYGTEYHFIDDEIDNKCYDLIEKYLTSKYSITNRADKIINRKAKEIGLFEWTEEDAMDLKKSIERDLL